MPFSSRAGSGAGSGGASIITGNITPTDASANPTNAINTADRNFVWDESASLWVFWRGTAVLGGRVNETQAPQFEDNTNGVAATQWKPLAVNTYAPTLFSQLGTDPDVSVKGSAGNVFSASCHNLNAAGRFLQLHNKASAPAGGDVPLLSFFVPNGAMLIVGSDFFTTSGIFFSTGIAYGFSTTEATYTAGAAADQVAFITYK